MLLDTIAAISTPRGEGGISIVRMSGQDSLNILEKIFKPKNKKVNELKNYSINVRKPISMVLSHHVCGNLSWQP